MKHLIRMLTVAAVFSFLVHTVTAQDTYKYIGVQRCSMCHKGKAKGEVYEIWKQTKHSTAYTTLLSEQSKEIAKKQGIEGPPEKEAKCLECHVTGFGEDPVKFMKSHKIEDGITCEACHGAGSAYQKITIMRDKQQFLANGGKVPTEKDCKVCHNEKSPTYKAFSWAKDYKTIEHHPAKK